MRGIRFRPDCIEWIKEGIKSTTFRKTRRNGRYEIVKGSWFKPIGLGIYVECYPIQKMSRYNLITARFRTEGDFKTPTEFITWLRTNKLWDKLPEEGWLNLVTFLYEEKSAFLYEGKSEMV